MRRQVQRREPLLVLRVHRRPDRGGTPSRRAPRHRLGRTGCGGPSACARSRRGSAARPPRAACALASVSGGAARRPCSGVRPPASRSSTLAPDGSRSRAHAGSTLALRCSAVTEPSHLESTLAPCSRSSSARLASPRRLATCSAEPPPASSSPAAAAALLATATARARRRRCQAVDVARLDEDLGGVGAAVERRQLQRYPSDWARRSDSNLPVLVSSASGVGRPSMAIRWTSRPSVSDLCAEPPPTSRMAKRRQGARAHGGASSGSSPPRRGSPPPRAARGRSTPARPRLGRCVEQSSPARLAGWLGGSAGSMSKCEVSCGVRPRPAAASRRCACRPARARRARTRAVAQAGRARPTRPRGRQTRARRRGRRRGRGGVAGVAARYEPRLLRARQPPERLHLHQHP